MKFTKRPVAMAVAGLDPSGGAGLIADIKTFLANGVYGMGAVTCVTAQNTVKVSSVNPASPEVLEDEIMTAVEDIKPAAVKVGMIGTRELIQTVRRCVSTLDAPIVLDPVMISSSGTPLLDGDAIGELEKLIPEVRLCDMTRIVYQQLLNDYARIHERQTTMDFHHQLKGAILDAVDEGLIDHDPTRKVIIKGKQPTEKKIKYLNQYELHTLLKGLNLGKEISWDWFILLVAKTGMRFSEALALTPKDFDLSHQMLSVSKTWDYKGKGGFLPTKNKSSVRKIQIDWQIVVQFSELLKGLPEDKPIFVTKERVYNSTVNDILARHCRALEIPVISVHGLRHTHASVLLFAGVSIGSVARRLGHASMTTTQKTYLHIIHELENQDVDLVMRSLSSLC